MAKRKTISKPKTDLATIRIFIPSRTYQAISEQVSAEVSRSSACRDLIAEIFAIGKPAPAELQELPDQPEGRWICIYLDGELKRRAAMEVRRRFGSDTDKRKAGSLAAVVAWLVTQKYGGGQ